jgi:hypothetical protein
MNPGQNEGAQIIGCELYLKLQNFLELYLEGLQQVKNKIFSILR